MKFLLKLIHLSGDIFQSFGERADSFLEVSYLALLVDCPGDQPQHQMLHAPPRSLAVINHRKTGRHSLSYCLEVWS